MRRRAVSVVVEAPPLETSTCPNCDGRPKRDLQKVACSAGTTFQTWVCGVCFGDGKIDRVVAREVWLSLHASA